MPRKKVHSESSFSSVYLAASIDNLKLLIFDNHSIMFHSLLLRPLRVSEFGAMHKVKVESAGKVVVRYT